MLMNYNKNFKICSMDCNSNSYLFSLLEFDINLLTESVT